MFCEVWALVCGQRTCRYIMCLSLQKEQLRAALGQKADQAETEAALRAVSGALTSKVERGECQQLLAHKLDIATFLSSQASAAEPLPTPSFQAPPSGHAASGHPAQHQTPALTLAARRGTSASPPSVDGANHACGRPARTVASDPWSHGQSGWPPGYPAASVQAHDARQLQPADTSRPTAETAPALGIGHACTTPGQWRHASPSDPPTHIPWQGWNHAQPGAGSTPQQACFRK
jgi:hypothetical protein